MHVFSTYVEVIPKSGEKLNVIPFLSYILRLLVSPFLIIHIILFFRVLLLNPLNQAITAIASAQQIQVGF